MNALNVPCPVVDTDETSWKPSSRVCTASGYAVAGRTSAAARTRGNNMPYMEFPFMVSPLFSWRMFLSHRFPIPMMTRHESEVPSSREMTSAFRSLRGDDRRGVRRHLPRPAPGSDRTDPGEALTFPWSRPRSGAVGGRSGGVSGGLFPVLLLDQIGPIRERPFLSHGPGRPEAAGDPEIPVFRRRQDDHLPLGGGDPGQRRDVHLVGHQDEIPRGRALTDERPDPARLLRLPAAVIEERVQGGPRLRAPERQPCRLETSAPPAGNGPIPRHAP